MPAPSIVELWGRMTPGTQKFVLALVDHLESGLEGELRVVCAQKSVREATIVNAKLLDLRPTRR